MLVISWTSLIGMDSASVYLQKLTNQLSCPLSSNCTNSNNYWVIEKNHHREL